jgi:hypothetical protein
MIGRLTFRTAAAALSAILALQSPSARCGQALDWHAPWLQPADPQAAQILSDEYAWRLFVALNWPADPVTRAADPAVRLGADRPVVWETWKSAGEVYLAGGVDPGAWDAPSGDAALRSARRFEVPSDKDFANARHIVNGAMVPLSDPLEGARRLTEIRLNRATFEFIRLRHLYSIEGQLRNYAANLAVVFPTGAREIKAKWRPIQPQERARYHTVEVQLADGSRRLYGLTALHILSKDLPTWFWATFEHVDNPGLPDSEGWRLQSRDRFACADAPWNCNRAPRGIGLEGTAWANYRLRGTLTAYLDAQGNPQRLANSELEAGFQPSSSCITCHARATVAALGEEAIRLPVFDSAGNFASPTARRGFVGLPAAAWYSPSAVAGQDRPRFQGLDYVWSLSLAQSERELLPQAASSVAGVQGAHALPAAMH